MKDFSKNPGFFQETVTKFFDKCCNIDDAFSTSMQSLLVHREYQIKAMIYVQERISSAALLFSGSKIVQVGINKQCPNIGDVLLCSATHYYITCSQYYCSKIQTQIGMQVVYLSYLHYICIPYRYYVVLVKLHKLR